jgi:hypothetical protein
MSITDQGPRSDAPTADVQGRVPALRSRLGTRGIVALVAGVAVVAGGVLVVSLGHHGGSTTPAPSGPPRAAADLEAPDRVGAATPVPMAEDITQGKEWKTQAAKALDGARYFARTYSTSPTSPTTRVVVAATDLTGKLDQAWAADAGTAVGDDHCTQNLQLGDRIGVRPTVSLCWRTSDGLSAYVLVIDPRHPVKPNAAAAALDEAWKHSLA